MSPKNKAILEMLICATMWSTGGIFIKLIPWNAMTIAGWRSLIAAGVVLLYLRLGHVSVCFSRQAAINGLFQCLTFVSFVVANKLTTAANAIVLQFTAPVFLMVYSTVLLHQKFRKGDALAVLCTLGGISLFFFDQLSPGYLLGNCIAIAAGAFMAGMYLSIGQADAPTRMGGMLLGHLFTAAVGIPFTVFTATKLSAVPVACILALGIIQLGVPYILLILSSDNCPPLACSLLGAVEPLLNPVWVFLFDGEAPGIFALLGGVIVVAAVTVWCV
ncbi:MAG: DMT family transporter [Oscillibacter sp.]|jgi:drug/metabolite transporter (DMT)-like permease|nr:DMT family transporter [Oscillibacter sp.]